MKLAWVGGLNRLKELYTLEYYLTIRIISALAWVGRFEFEAHTRYSF